MGYDLRVLTVVEKQLIAFPEKHQGQILKKLTALASDPRPVGSKLFAREGDYEIYRIKSGEYRILYGINDGALVVLAIHVGNRKDVYRNLEAVYKRVLESPPRKDVVAAVERVRKRHRKALDRLK
jgi:mRNA interferase RelE/StbE